MEVKQNNLIKSLRLQPLIVVIRLENNFFNFSQKKENLLSKIQKLSDLGIKNIEIGWNSNQLILELHQLHRDNL